MARKQKSLAEGFVQSVGQGLRQFFARSPEIVSAEIRRGGTPSIERAGLPYNLASQFGYDGLAEHLRIDQDLMARYTDYEEMDEYPEISCLSGASMVFTLESGWQRIDGLATRGEAFHVLAYDRERRSLVPAMATRAWKSGEAGHTKKMVRVVLDNGAQIECTADHRFLIKDGAWVEAGALTVGARLMPDDTATLEAALQDADGSVAEAAQKLGVSWSTVKARAFDLNADAGNHRVLRVEDIGGSPDVFDLEVPGYHNFVCNGVVVHNSAFDIYADDATMPDMEESKSIWVTSENEAVAKELDMVLHKRLGIEDDIWGSARTLGKYGNNFAEAVVGEQGLVGLNYLAPPTIRRVESPRGALLGFIQDVRGEFNISMEDFYQLAKDQVRGGPGMVGRGRAPGEMTIFEDWEVIHWRLRGKHMRSVYGHSVADPARWIWKRLALLEDAILIYKLSRAPSRYAFYIDVGELDNVRGLAYVNNVKNSFIKKKFLNPITNKLDMRHNPLAHDEDFFVPSRNGKDSTRIEVLQGPDYSETDTVEYHRDKLVAGIKIPKTYLGYGGESTRASLSSEDIRFARTVMRIQRELRSGYRKACRIHLIAIGQNPDQLEYDVQMSVPSAILELAKLEVLSATADVASRMGEAVSTRWILTKLYKFTEEEAVRLMDEREEEQLRRGEVEANIQQMAMQAAQPPPQEGEVEYGNQYGGDGQDQEQPQQGQQGQQGQESRKKSGKSLSERKTRMAQPQQWRGKRLSEIMSGRRKNWQQEFMGRPDSRYAEDKLATILKGDRDLARRLKSIEGMLGDIKSSLG